MVEFLTAPEERSQRRARRRPLSRVLLWTGVALGFGAPIGFAILRRLALRSPLRRYGAHDGPAYAYMASSTPIVFGLFGHLLGCLCDRLNEAHEHIEQLRAEFIAIVAHDLRDPVHAIGMQLEMLLRHARDGEVTVPEAALGRLYRSSARLGEMVTDLLDASRIEALRLRIAPQVVALPEAVSSALDELRPTLLAHPITLHVDGELPLVRVDRKRLGQILTNLVQNAKNHACEGSPITVRVQARDGGVALSVEDEGSGIPAAELPFLFDRFYQGKRAREKSSGLGLGLYITKGLVEAHGGRITVASEPGRGSTFTVWFPAARPPAALGAAGASENIVPSARA